jgi:UTP--glucose-1-phosphate uridylyltransferase
MIFITGRNKRAIEDHFDKAYELETELSAKNKQALLEWCSDARRRDQLHLHPADRSAGLGHAVLCARRWSATSRSR